MATQLSINERLRRLRETAGMSLRDLERESGINRSNLLRIERGDARPKPETLTTLAAVYGVDAAELLASAGYTSDQASALPPMTAYLRTKYGHLPTTARKELATVLERLEAEYGQKPKTSKK